MGKTRRIGMAIVALALLGAGCAGDPWRGVLRIDSLAEYRRYVNQYSESKNVVKAKEHIAFLELERAPSLKGYTLFKSTYPKSQLAEGLRPQFESKAFERARFSGTPAAYTDFMANFPDGPLAERALGNLVFIEAGGFSSGARSLDDFAQSHPRSDYAGEARRSADSLNLRDRENFARVGLVLKISTEVPESSRLVKEFSERAMKQYASAGYELVPVPELQSSSRAAKLPRARLVIEHRELKAKVRMDRGNLTRPGMVATTRISLYAKPGAEPIWQQKFQLRLSAQEHFSGRSMLFTPNARDYWASFFVPVASWPNRAALRNPIVDEKQIVAVDSVGDRAVVLYRDGGFQLIELSNSEAPLSLAKFRRQKDFTRWDGVKIQGQHILIYGEDGLEVYGFGKSGPVKVGVQERQNIGSIRAVVPHGKNLLLASNRGLLITDAKAGKPRRLLRRPVRGVAKVGDLVVFCDKESLFVSTVELLEEQRILRRLKLGYDFAPSDIIALEGSAVVLGKTGVMIVDLDDPKHPKVVSRLGHQEVGEVRDAAVVAGRIFFLGDRGLQLLNSSFKHVEESVDVVAKSRVSRMGRFLVAIGDQGLQVVDTAPLTGRSRTKAAAAPSR